jgi:TatD family-associated radical SAM protein
MIAYRLHDNLYLNLTNRCPNNCTFCLRRRREGIGGQHLWLDQEPDAAAVLAAVGDPRPYREIVFCGFGEPLLRPGVVREVAVALRQHYPDGRFRLRVDTNGLANLVFGRNVLEDLAGLIDAVSLSLNAPTAEEYERLCQPGLPGAFAAVLEFAREAVKVVPEVTLTAVSVPGVDLEACRRLAEGLGARFRVRAFIKDEEEV